MRESLTSAPTIVIVGEPDFAGHARQDALGAGLRPVCTRDGREALAALMHGRPAMLLIDSAMPDSHREWLLDRIERSPALARIPRAVFPRQELSAT
jgi:CheY-like chemotaxis protein